jgi:TonB family protein
MFDNFSSSKGRSPHSIAISLAIHCALVIGIVGAGYAVESIVAPRRVATVQLMAPPPPIKRVAVRVPRPTIRVAARLSPPIITMSAPRIIQPTLVLVKSTPAPVIIAQASVIPAELPVASAPVPERMPNPSLQVQTGGFASASAAPSGNNRAVQIVNAGFGDAAGVPSTGTRRSVSASGFGDGGIASAATASRGPIRSGGFGDTVSASPSAGGARLQTAALATAAQILQKPRPAYTDEARKLEIEGEVQLEVVFGASGEVHILRVVRGLGHGLDENAVLAAKAIRFLPAKRDGHTVDSTAMVHIIFQLAS